MNQNIYIKNTKKLILSILAFALALSCGYSTDYFISVSTHSHSILILTLIALVALSSVALNFKLYLTAALEASEAQATAKNKSKIKYLYWFITLLCALTTCIFTYYTMGELNAPLFSTILCVLAAFILTIYLLDFNPKKIFNDIKSLWSSCKSKLRKAMFVLISMIFVAANVGAGVTTFCSMKEFIGKYIKNQYLVTAIACLLIIGFITAEISFSLGVASRISMKNNLKSKKALLYSIPVLCNATGNAYIAKADCGGPAMATCGGMLSAGTMHDSLTQNEDSMLKMIGSNVLGKVFLGLALTNIAAILVCLQLQTANMIIWLPITTSLALTFGILFIVFNKDPIPNVTKIREVPKPASKTSTEQVVTKRPLLKEPKPRKSPGNQAVA